MISTGKIPVHRALYLAMHNKGFKKERGRKVKTRLLRKMWSEGESPLSGSHGPLTTSTRDLDARMPPGPAFNWLTVAHSALQILDHALKYRAAQISLGRSPTTLVSLKERHPRKEPEEGQGINESATPLHEHLSPPSAFVQFQVNEALPKQLPATTISLPVPEAQNLLGPTASSTIGLTPQRSNPASPTSSTETEAGPPALEAKTPQRYDHLSRGVPEAPPQDVRHSTSDHPQVLASGSKSERHLQSSKVPSSRIGRLFHYGGSCTITHFRLVPLLELTFVTSGLAASLGYGAASEFLRRSTTPSHNPTDSRSSLMMTEANLTRLVSKLTRMRGAALKVGQFLSIQGTHAPIFTPGRLDTTWGLQIRMCFLQN